MGEGWDREMADPAVEADGVIAAHDERAGAGRKDDGVYRAGVCGVHTHLVYGQCGRACLEDVLVEHVGCEMNLSPSCERFWDLPLPSCTRMPITPAWLEDAQERVHIWFTFGRLSMWALMEGTSINTAGTDIKRRRRRHLVETRMSVRRRQHQDRIAPPGSIIRLHRT